MKIYLLDDLYVKGHNASYKAKNDVNLKFLEVFGEGSIFNFYRFVFPDFGNKSRFKRVFLRSLMFRLNQINFFKFTSKIQNGDAIVIPFPFEFQWYVKLTRFVYKQLINMKLKKNVKLIFFIHDINSLRFPHLFSEETELNILKYADIIISHNGAMTNWLIEKNIPKDNIIDLGLFDYISPDIVTNDNIDYKNNSDRGVIYAGNLSPWKSEFLYQWTPKYNVQLYGVGFDESKINEGMIWNGVFDPDKPSINTKGLYFGLIWDGTSIEQPDGAGKYLKYNNPHKISLYLSQQLPVIVWSESALSSFVVENKLGFTIDKLSDISTILDNLTIEEYIDIKNNVRQVSLKLRNGQFVKDALIAMAERLKNN